MSRSTFQDQALRMAVAVGLAESGGNPTARNPNPPTPGCPTGSVDRGGWQLNDCYHAEVPTPAPTSSPAPRSRPTASQPPAPTGPPGSPSPAAPGRPSSPPLTAGSPPWIPPTRSAAPARRRSTGPRRAATGRPYPLPDRRVAWQHRPRRRRVIHRPGGELRSLSREARKFGITKETRAGRRQ